MVFWGFVVNVIGVGLLLFLFVVGIGIVFSFFVFMMFVGLGNGMVILNVMVGVFLVCLYFVGIVLGFVSVIMIGGGVGFLVLVGVLFEIWLMFYLFLLLMLVIVLVVLVVIMLIICCERCF